MAKVKKRVPKDLVTLDKLPEDFHVAINLDWPAARIRMATDGRSHFRSTCVRCDTIFAYTGKNPKYCPKCLKLLRANGRA